MIFPLQNPIDLPPVVVRLLDPSFELIERMEVSSGTRPVDTCEIETLNYELEARLPQAPWRHLTPAEAVRMQPETVALDWSRSVIILKLPFEVTEKVRNALSHTQNEDVASAFLKVVETMCDVTDPVWIGPSSNPPNQKSVTIDHQLGRRIGLHVDSWDELPINDLPKATNRICFNIGSQDRHLLFIPFPLAEIAKYLQQKQILQREAFKRPTLIGRLFMKQFDKIPVVRCRLAPGEAYIAPTENLIHDGSSEGQTGLDQQLTIRGHIRV